MTNPTIKKKLKKLLSIPKIEQKSTEWYNVRQNLITASDFAQALGKGKFGTQKQFYKKKCEVCTDSLESSAYNPFFKWGNMFEDVALSVYSDLNNKVHIHEFGLILHPTRKFFGASPDGITEDGIMVEIKCPKKRKISGEVPLQYYYQIQGQLDVCDLDDCDYFECEFEQIENIVDYYSFCEEFEYWGIVCENSNTSFEYSPLNAPVSKLKEWAREHETKTLLFWVLKKHNCIRVKKDDVFVKEKLDELEKVWNNIQLYKKDTNLYLLECLQNISIETQPYQKTSSREECVIDDNNGNLQLPQYAFLDDY